MELYYPFLAVLCLAPCVVNLERIFGATTMTIEPTSFTYKNSTGADDLSPIEILGKQPIRMIQGSTRLVFIEYADFLGDFYSLEISSSDTSVVRIIEEDGIELPAVDFDETIAMPSNDSSRNDSLVYSMAMGNFTLKGVRFGKAYLMLRLRSTDTGEIDEELTDMLPTPNVAVIRLPTTFDIVFGYALLVVSALTTGIMGCEIEWDVIKGIFVRPFGIIIGACCQFIIMPLAAFCLCIAFKLPNDLSIGVLLAACSPGGGMSNMTTVVVEGHLILSIAMTFMSTCLAIGMMPLNLFIYSRRFMDKSTFPIPFDKIIMGLALLLGPLAAGFLLRRYKPTVAEKILKVLKPACLVVVLLTMAGGLYTIRYVFTYIVPNMIICSFLLPLVAFVLGGSTALLVRRPIKEVKTISIETGIQNVAIAAAIIRLTYPYPEADMVASTVMWTMLGQFFAVTVMMISYTIYKRCCKKPKTHMPIVNEDEVGEPALEMTTKNGVIGKPLQVTSDANFQTVHAHLARIKQHSNGNYHQLSQHEVSSNHNNANGITVHNRYGGYARLPSSTSTAYSGATSPELDHRRYNTSVMDGGRVAINEESIWQPNPTAAQVDYTVFTDEND